MLCHTVFGAATPVPVDPWVSEGSVFSSLAVLYLFAGGAGAGAVATCCALDLFLVRQPFGMTGYRPRPSVRACDANLDNSFYTGFVLLAVGAVSLTVDLGRADRVMSLFLNPHLTVMTVGAYALALALLLAGFLVAVRLMYLPEFPRALVRGVEVAALVDSFVVMAYTGVLLQSLNGIAFWSTPLLPALFVVSSLSCGVAVVFFVALVSGQAEPLQLRMLRYLARADVVLIVTELVVAVLFVVASGASTHPATKESLDILTQGTAAWAWWFGFIVCGLLVPLAFELAPVRAPEARTVLAAAALFVLIGALCLRWSVVESGVHRDLALSPAIIEFVIDT